jgi:hypothetical protein
MSQTQLWAGVPVQIQAVITDSAGNPYSLASCSASYGSPGGGPPAVVALATSETGTYTGTITPTATGTLTVTVAGYDSESTLQVVGVCREIVSPVPYV